MSESTLAELSRQVAIAKGWTKEFSGAWKSPEKKWSYPPNFTEPARLYELEGELQQAGWSFEYDDGAGRSVKGESRWMALTSYAAPDLTEPATPEGRARLILRATLEAQL